MPDAWVRWTESLRDGIQSKTPVVMLSMLVRESRP
jgi:hypothetical protein